MNNPDVNMPVNVYCAKCQHVTTPYYAHCPKCEGDRNREKVDALALVIRALKATLDAPVRGDEVAQLKAQLLRLDHPAPREFLQWLDDARAARSTSNRRHR